VDDDCIFQRGEPWQRVASPFSVIDDPRLQQLRARGVRVT
jgi:hypothetical protein